MPADWIACTEPSNWLTHRTAINKISMHVYILHILHFKLVMVTLQFNNDVSNKLTGMKCFTYFTCNIDTGQWKIAITEFISGCACPPVCIGVCFSIKYAYWSSKIPPWSWPYLYGSNERSLNFYAENTAQY